MRHRAFVTGLTLVALILAFASLLPARARLAPPPAAADTEQPPPAERLAGYLERNASCHAVTDGCHVCVRTTANKAHCSTPGIACQPTGWQCRRPEPVGLPAK